MKPSSIRNFGSIGVEFWKVRHLVVIWWESWRMFQSTLPTLNVLDFSEPFNKPQVCTPERHLKHHVNLTTNNDNYGGPQLPHQNQMHTANYKSLTANSNRSQQLQIAHSKLKSLTANYKSLTANYKSLTVN